MIRWADLPKEIWENIRKHLDSRIDAFRFRAVCTSWRSVVSPSYRQCQSYVILSPPISATALLSPVTICRLEHQGVACMVKVLESTSGQLQLINPFSCDPQIKQVSNNKTLDLLDFHLIELARGYRLNFRSKPSNFNLKKVILFHNCGILALFGLGKLGFWEFGIKEWTNLGDEGYYYDDIMVYKNQFYVIDSLGIISWIDKSMSLVQYSPPLCGLGDLKNLVESDGQFYAIDSYLEEEKEGHPYRRVVDMKVYKLDEEWGTWVDVKSLGNRVFVLTKEVCFSTSVEDSTMGNRIYFVNPKGTRNRYTGGVFRFDNGRINVVGCFPTCKELSSPSLDWPFSTTSSLRTIKRFERDRTYGRLFKYKS